VILDFQQFVANESPYWKELEALLDHVENSGISAMTLDEAKRFHYLYQRASSDLARLSGYSLDAGTRSKLEALVARAYAEAHETRARSFPRLSVNKAMTAFARTFRRNFWAFEITLAVTLIGAVFGAFLIYADKDAKAILLPFEHLQGNPSDRVDYEESHHENRMEGHFTSFSAMLMTHNIRVSVFAAALGVSFGLGTILVIFGNGLILGAVVFDYIRAGEGVFVAGWLMPHGVIEIPAILIAGQAGLIVGRAFLGHGDATPLRKRLRETRGDVLTLIYGAAVMLVWAGVIESFLSQYHEPIIPYYAKIIFGVVELACLCCCLALPGRKAQDA
jgi:uncharacterized membrane protein SpoIIM required for sporulation